MTLAERQLAMLRRMAALDPAPVFIGGYAEDALAAGTVTRPHQDLDWFFPRRELDLRRAQAEKLGFTGFETWGEAAPGEPFYVYAWTPDDVRLDLGIADEEDGPLWVKVHRLFFEVDGREAPAGFRVRMRDDTLTQPPSRSTGSRSGPSRHWRSTSCASVSQVRARSASSRRPSCDPRSVCA
jgi:hypothetical protein